MAQKHPEVLATFTDNHPEPASKINKLGDGYLVRDEGVAGSNPATPTISGHSGTDTAQIPALVAFRRDLTNRRNIEPDNAVRERLTTLINNVEGRLRDPSDAECAAMLLANCDELQAFMAARGVAAAQ